MGPTRSSPAPGPLHPDPSRYRVSVLTAAEATDAGIAYRDDAGGPSQLSWTEVQFALAAEVGEPEGVRTIVFDLVLDRRDDRYAVCRLDADPGEDAMSLARAIVAGLGPGIDCPSIKSVATDGTPSRWYPDLQSLAEAALEILGSRPS